MSDEIPETLYHYTSAQGLLGIIESRTLRATDTRYLNDVHELTYGSATIVDELYRAANTLDPHNNDGPLVGPKAKATELRIAAQTVERGGLFERNELGDAYVTCFCDDSDQLGQWRGYGSDGGGFAIGFQGSALRELAHKLQRDGANMLAVPEPRRVIYGPDAVTARCADIVESILRFEPNADPVSTGVFDAYRICLPELAFMKDHAFREEREWRVLIINIADRTLKFRPDGTLGVIPYVDITFPVNAIREVIVGPGPHKELRKQAVEQLLADNKYTDTTVRTSEVPYRP